MDQLGPAAVGGVVACLMLWAWALGRWQRGFAAAPTVEDDEVSRLVEPAAVDAADATPARPCQEAAREERRDVIASAASLGEIHADVTAYRRAAQVLAQLGPEESALDLTGSPESADCRYIGISGRPTCPMGYAARVPQVCDSCTIGRPNLAALWDQPSASLPGLTRV